MNDELITTEKETKLEERALPEDVPGTPLREEPLDYPETPPTAPSHDYHAANKKYVDDVASGLTIPTGPTDVAFIYFYEGLAYLAVSGSSVTIIASVSISTYYEFTLEFDAPNNKVRAKVDAGAFSNWLYPNIAWSTVDAIRIAGKGIGYWDEASGPLTDGFEDYEVGNLDGQDGWSGNGLFQVTESNPSAGTKCVYLSGDDSVPWIQKNVVPVATGTQVIKCRTESNAAGKSIYAIILITL